MLKIVYQKKKEDVENWLRKRKNVSNIHYFYLSGQQWSALTRQTAGWTLFYAEQFISCEFVVEISASKCYIKSHIFAKQQKKNILKKFERYWRGPVQKKRIIQKKKENDPCILIFYEVNLTASLFNMPQKAALLIYIYKTETFETLTFFYISII